MSAGHVSPTVCLSACMSATQSDISISQQTVPETLRLFLHPANHMQRDGGKEGERTIEERKGKKKAREEEDKSISDVCGGSE